MSSDKQLEVEVKFLVADLAGFRERLLLAGGTPQKERIFERNIRFDTPDNTLLKKGELLRLRQDAAIRVTFKGEVTAEVVSEAKVREELEVSVNNFETTAKIFERLGFAPVQIYEKYRETFMLNDVEIVLDEMPFGDFVELEGEESAIKTMSAALALDWSRRINDSYLGLMADLKQFHQLDFDDLTFANFAGRKISIADIVLAT
ncbi:MAG: class IV adenylate cyclase [Chloroflexi bacterium]|nr:MAG: class IV adenylate cyclase [Chloroflexota bacterium]